MKNNFLPAICLLACLALTGCHPKEKTTLHFFFRGDLAEIDITTELIYNFEKEHPDIDVLIDVNNSYLDNLLFKGRTGKPLDVVFVELRELRPLYEQNHLIPLNQFLYNDNDILLSAYYPNAVQAFQRDKKLYVLPRDIAPHGYIFVNKSILQEANVPCPDKNWSWPNDFLKTLASVQTYVEKSGKEYFTYLEDWHSIENLALSTGLTFEDLKAPHKLSEEKHNTMLECFTLFQRLHQLYKTPPYFIDRSELFMNGKVAFFFTGYWKTPYYRINNSFDWDIVLFPKGPHGPRHFTCGGSGYAISKNSSNPQKAWELVKYLAGKPGQPSFVKAGLVQPVNKSFIQPEYLGKNTRPYNKAALTYAADHILFEPPTTEWLDIRYQCLEQELNDMVYPPHKDPKQALKAFTQKVIDYEKRQR